MRMMDLPKLFILDVAHGNCAILQDTEGTVIIDCAHGDTLIETLRQLNINPHSARNGREKRIKKQVQG
jgi:hypothetical protein